MECYGHAEIVYTFQWIEKKVKKGRIKESPWRSRQIVSGITVLYIQRDYLCCVEFMEPYT